MKKCKVCLEEKELFLFDKISKSGYRGTCRKCRNKKGTSVYLQKEGNIEKRRLYMKKYMKEKYENDINYRMYSTLLSNLKSKIKTDLYRSHFENLFTSEMNWDNYGLYWEVDHIIPALKMLRAGYSENEINSLNNLRPMIIKENRERPKISSKS